MEPLAAAGYVMIAAAAVLAIGLGALAGAIARIAQCNPLWPGLLAVAGYLVETVVLHSAAPGPAILIGFPPLLMALLIAWLLAGTLGRRYGLNRVWAAFAGLVGALLVGFLWGFTFRLGIWPPVSLAVAVDVGLIIMLFVRRQGSTRMDSAEES